MRLIGLSLRLSKYGNRFISLALGVSNESIQHDRLKDLVSQLHNRTGPRDASFYAGLLRACAQSKALVEGRQIHRFIVSDNLEQHRFLVSNLIVMYGKCGALDEAEKLLERMHQGSVFSWTAMIRACTQNGRNDKALELFHRMRRVGLKPNFHALVALVNACASLGDLETGRLVHSDISDRDLEQSSVLGNSVVSMYSRCGSLEEAKKAFDGLPRRDVVTWNALISAYVRSDRKAEALEAFRKMEKEGIRPNNVTYISVLDSCLGLLSGEEIQNIHADIVKHGLEDDVYVGTVLVDMYGKRGNMDAAWKVFRKLTERSMITWSAMISACSQNGLDREALHLFRAMHLEGVKPSAVTFVAVLSSCTEGTLDAVEVIKEQLKETSFLGDNILGTALLSTYARCNNLRQARLMFDRIEKADVISWNAMVAAYLQHNHCEEAFLFFEQMLLQGMKPTALTFISLLTACADCGVLNRGQKIFSYASELGLDAEIAVANAYLSVYGKSGYLRDARETFERMAQKDLISWNTVLAAYCQHGSGREAVDFFYRMAAEKVELNRVTFVTVLDAIVSKTTTSEARQIHARVIESGFQNDPVVQNALLNVYAKCGNLEDAQLIFDSSSDQDVVSWTTLLAGYAQHGHAENALKLFKRMQQTGVRPNQISFISALGACSHAGLLEEGCKLFFGMRDDHGLAPTSKHFGCLVDLLGRCGRLNEAEKILKRMPFEADIVAWMALLGACKNNNDVERAQRCADRIMELDPHFASAYIVLSSIYAAAGKWTEAANIRKAMLEKGIKGDPGCSAIEVSDELHAFVAGDKSHPRTEEIYQELDRLSRDIKEAGYVPDTGMVLHNVSQEQKEQLLLRHSEKVALAFGLLSTPRGTPLKVIKNLRVCSDCHAATKFISKVMGREILMRDSSRFHKFVDGACSCEDYW